MKQTRVPSNGMSEEELPPDYEDIAIQVEGKHIILGLSFCLLGILAVGGGLIYYREGLRFKRQERFMETVLKVIDLLSVTDKAVPNITDKEVKS